jgi:uncharacterized membrane protein YecN with MAPEG domain
MHSAPYFTAFGLLTILHSLRLSQLRWRYKVQFGDGGQPELAHRIRVFGNFIEYVPLGLILVIALEFVQAPSWYVHFAGFTLLAGHYLHALGLGNTKPRFQVVGMVLTHASLLVSSLGISFWSLTAIGTQP